MQSTRTVTGTAPTTIVGIGLLLTAGYAVGLLVLMEHSTFDTWGAAVVAPILVAVSVPVLYRQAAREGDPTLFRLLLLALVVKLAGSLLRYYAAVAFYGAPMDATAYGKWGIQLSEGFRHGDFATGLQDLSGTNFLRLLTGVVYTLIGPSKLAGFVFFSWLAFWGLFLAYRAFVIAVPEGRARSYAHLVFFLPSLVFWPSSIGKEAWMTLAIGVVAFGAARLLGRWSLHGALVLGGGLWLTWVVRPHIAGLLGAALALAVVTRRSAEGSRELAPVIKAVSIAAVAVLALLLAGKASTFLQGSGVELDKGVTQALFDVQDRTAGGGSEFVPPVADSPARIPAAAVTVLFRPFVFEASNTQGIIAALESMLILAICVLRMPWIVAAFKSIRRQPYVVFCVAYVALGIVAFSSFSNFGLLARQRVQLYPLLLVLISIPPPGVRARAGEVVDDAPGSP